MKAADRAIQLLFVLSLTRHATGTRKLTEFLLGCMNMSALVIVFLCISSCSLLLRLQPSWEANIDQMPFSRKRDFYLLVGTRL